MPRKRIRPPDWWNQNLYSFVQTMPPEGWVWEFTRRAKLLQILGNVPVDAENPNPDMENLRSDYLSYYKSWAWYSTHNKRPLFLPPAVSPPSGWPRGFQGQQYRIYDRIAPDQELETQQQPTERQIIRISVDLNRRNSVIKRDFNEILESARAQHPEPRRRNPRFSNWPDMHILEVWDLRQFRVVWKDIVLEFDRSHARNQIPDHHIQSVRNAYNTARSYINGGKWLELALHIDVE